MKCRKLLAILLALVMVIGLLPFAALAEEVPGSSPGDEVSDKIVADQNDPLPEGDPLGEQPPEVSLLNNEHHAGATALKSTDSELFDGSYYLSEDVKLNKPVKFSGTATLCLNGHKLSCGSDKVITVDGTLTICDCDGGGKIEATDRANFAINVERNGTLNVEGGTICGGYRGISGSLNSEINISGGTIQKSGSSTYKALELNGTTATITDGTITGGVELKSSSKLSLGGTPTVDTIKLTHTSCSINATAASEPYSGGSITIDYGNLDYRDGTAIVSGVTEENAESFIVNPPEGMVVKLDENGNLVFGEPASNPGHSHEDDDPSVTWTELTAQDRQLKSGHYYLGNDITVSKTTDHISITGDVTLCLNSHALTSTVAQTSFIYVENGGSLTLCDCGNGGKVESLCGSSRRVIFVREGGSCTIESGMISGIDDTLNGETIMVDSRGSLTLNGGKVTGSTGIYNRGTTTVSGGTVECDKYGIYVGGNLGVVNMKSGSVSATGSDEVSGIYMNYGSLVMTGGTVSGTTYGIALQTADEEKSFVISDGTITGGYGIYYNSEKCNSPLYLTGKPTLSTLHLSKPTTLIFASKDGSPYSGGKVTVSLESGEKESAVIISGISNNANKFTYAGEDFELKEDGKGNLILQTPTTAPEHANHGVDGGSGSQTWTAWDGTSDLAADGHYYLADNVTLTETIQVRGDVYLCLNGKTLASTADYAVEVTEGHALTICDCGVGGSIERTHHESDSNGCAVLVRGDFTLYGGSLKNHGRNGYGIFVTAPGGGSHVTIAGGSVSSDVNAIQVGSASDVTLRGGQVYGKKSGVVLANDGISFTMTGGSVTGENERGITTNNYDITLSISDGTIHGGDAGIRLLTTSDGGTTISGGTITSENGVGIDQMDLSLNGWGEEVQEATLTLTGAPDIESLRLEVAGKVNGAGYTGKALDVAFVKDDAADDDIVIAGATDPAKFNLTAPKGKILVAQGGNLVLSSKPAGHQDHDADGTGEIPTGKEWIAWNGTTQMDTAGYYYLDKDITLTSTIKVTADVHLCLNGYSITAPEEGGASTMFNIEKSGKLSVCDCQEGGRIEMLRDGSNNMAIQVMSRRTFDLYSGTIYAAGSSRAVYSNGGTVNVSGGIIESPSTINGALRADGKDAVVNLSGGEIKGRVQLRTGAKLYLSNAPTLSYVDIKAINTAYPIQIHAASKDGTSYTGGAIEISTVETNLEPGHIVVYNVNENNDELFTLKDNRIVRDGDNLVIASDGTIELTVTSPDFTYGDENAVIEVTTVPADATVTFSRYIDDPGTLGMIDPDTGKLTGFDAGTFTVTVTATKEGYTAVSEQVTFTVKKKDVTITPKEQRIDYSDEIAQGMNQVTVTGLVNEDVLSEITLTADKSAKTITASNAVIKNGDRNVNKNYDVTYASGTLTLYNVPQEGFAITGAPTTFTYGDTFRLTATGGSGEGAVTWEATGAADVQDGNVTITGTGAFTITATKAGDTTYQAAEAEVTGTAAAKAITITAEDQHLEYGDTIEKDVQQVAVTTLVTGDTLDSIVLTAGDTDITPSNAVIKKGDTDVSDYYTITYVPGSLTFYNVPQEGFAITGKPATVTYGDTFKLTATGGSGEGAVTWTAEGAAKVDQEGNVTITGAGDFTIKATKAGDDTFAAATATYQGTAQKRALTITADDETIAFNAAAPSYTATVTGAVKADEAAIVAAYALTSTYVKGDPVDDYPITVTVNLSADLLEKYTVTKKDGTLHVVKALAEVVKAPDAVENLVYTGKAQKLVTAGEAKNGTMVYSLNGTTYQEAVPTRINAGTYTVWYKVVGNNGYSDTAAKSFNVTIKKAPLTVTADDIWVYAGNTPKFTATIKGYVNGEDWRVLKGELTFTCGYSQKYSKPGSRYTITPKGLTADNYDITFKTGTLTVKDPLSPRFNVYVLDSKHGTVEADCRYARKGDVVTLTIKPDWGYELETLTVTDSHGYELKLTYHSNGTYTFTMPRDNVTVKAIFTVRDMPFVDVPGDAWYAGGVRYVYAHGLMNGTGNWRFSPNRTTTRAMIATILYRMEGSPRVYGTSQFGDVEAGSWYEDAVIWATQNDIVEGYTSKTFGPDDPITREQMAAMLYRYADYCRCDMSAGRYVDLSKYSDMNEISDYAIPALRWAVGEEIIQGRTGKRLAPTDTATRAEVAVMLMRFCEDVIW